MVVLATVLTGCGLGTVRWSVNDPKFQEENQPFRKVNLFVYSDNSYLEDTLLKNTPDHRS
jgi:hypothetical protein